MDLHVHAKLSSQAKRSISRSFSQSRHLGKGNSRVGSILNPDTTVDNTLVDSAGLETFTEEVLARVGGVLVDTKVKLAVSEHVVGEGLGLLGKGVIASGGEDLDGAKGLGLAGDAGNT